MGFFPLIGQFEENHVKAEIHHAVGLVCVEPGGGWYCVGFCWGSSGLGLMHIR